MDEADDYEHFDLNKKAEFQSSVSANDKSSFCFFYTVVYGKLAHGKRRDSQATVVFLRNEHLHELAEALRRNSSKAGNLESLVLRYYCESPKTKDFRNSAHQGLSADKKSGNLVASLRPCAASERAHDHEEF